MNGFKPNLAAQARWKSAMEHVAYISNKDNPKGMQKLVLQSARRVVKNLAAITPPATGKADTAAKKRGEAAIVGDLLKIAIPAQAIGVSAAKAREAFAAGEELMEARTRARSGGGRVNPRNRKDKLLVEQREFNRVVKVLFARVGWLAAALNAAAAKLGFRLPKWIARHGSKFGRIIITTHQHRIRITIVQNVPYADDVSGYASKFHAAFQKEVRTLQQMAGVLYRREGFRRIPK